MTSFLLYRGTYNETIQKKNQSYSLLVYLHFHYCLQGATVATKSKRETVRIAEVTRSIFYAPQYVAIEKGFFKDEGINVKLTTTWGGDKTMTALLSDGADVALVGSETTIYVHAQDSTDPVINFAQLTQTDGTFLVARKNQISFLGNS